MILPIHTEVHVKTIIAQVRQGLNHNDLMFLWRKCFFQVFSSHIYTEEVREFQ